MMKYCTTETTKIFLPRKFVDTYSSFSLTTFYTKLSNFHSATQNIKTFFIMNKKGIDQAL